LLLAAVSLRRAHLLSVLDIADRRERTLMQLAIATCERSIRRPDLATKVESAPSESEPDRDAGHASDQGHRAGLGDAQPRSVPPSATRTTPKARVLASQRSPSLRS
jgi:hypothetical protein